MSAIGLLGLVAAILTSVLTWIGAAWPQGGNWPSSITIGTASPGGVYGAYGEGLARILTRTLQIEVTAQVTQGPAQNIVLMEKREAMLGFATIGVALQGWNGTDWAKGTRYRSMRIIFPMYDTAFQFATLKRLAIKSLDDLAGLRIGVGPRAGTSGTYVPEIFKLLGIAVDIRFGSNNWLCRWPTANSTGASLLADSRSPRWPNSTPSSHSISYNLRPSKVQS